MSRARVFDANAMEWSGHERFPGIRIKELETRATHPLADVLLVRLSPGGVIETHIHEKETETAYVLAGRGELTAGADQIVFEPGTGASIPPGVPHRLQNTGDQALELIAIHTPPTR